MRVDAANAARAIVGMDRRLQVLIRERFVRHASKSDLQVSEASKLELRQMQFQRAEMAGVERGLQQAFAFGQIARIARV